MSLTSDQFAAGRQVKRGSKTYDVLDVVTGQGGNSFALLKSGDTTDLVPVAAFRDDESDWESVSVEDQEAAREKAAQKDGSDDSSDDDDDSGSSSSSKTSTPRKKS